MTQITSKTNLSKLFTNSFPLFPVQTPLLRLF